MNCLRCGQLVAPSSRRDRFYCRNSCRQQAYVARKAGDRAVTPRWQHSALTADDPVLSTAAHRAKEVGQTNGWSPSTINCTIDGLTALLSGRLPGQQVSTSQIRSQTARTTSTPRVAEILAELDLLTDDTPPAIRHWIDRRTTAVPEGFAADIRGWLLHLLDGDARHRPRSPTSLYVYFGAVRPFLTRWAATRTRLREITTDDIVTILDDLEPLGWRRHNAISALRSLFGYAKRGRLIYTDPTRRLTAGTMTTTQLPLTDAEVVAIQQIAATPAQRMVIALTAVHAVRPAPIRQLRLDDVDLPNRRITLAGHPATLGDLTYRALETWLQHRRTLWPHTPNPHVLISTRTALTTTAVTEQYLKMHLVRRSVDLARIRADRILTEALAVGPDPLHLTLMFNLSHTAASRYSMIAGALLDDADLLTVASTADEFVSMKVIGRARSAL